jgi:hypothetical protein
MAKFLKRAKLLKILGIQKSFFDFLNFLVKLGYQEKN